MSNISDTTNVKSKYNIYILSFLVLLVSFMVFLPSLNNGFVWDDVINIQQEYYKFKNSNFKSILIPKKIERKQNSYYRPIIHLTIVSDYKVWGNNPFGHHLSNSIFYSVSSLLFFFLVLLILKEFHIRDKELIAVLATAIYIVHPMHVESVSWIAGRTDIICTIFFLAAFISHIYSYRHFWLIPFTFLFFILSFLSKEIAVAFPFVVLAFDLLKSKKLNIKNYYISIIYFLLLIFLLMLRGRSFNNLPGLSLVKIGNDPKAALDFVSYLKSLEIMLSSYLFYFYKLVLPIKFNAFISEVPKNIFITISSVLVFVGLLFGIIFSIVKKSGLKAFTIICLIFTLAPSVLVSVIKISSTPLAERYIFLPICFFALLIAYLIYPFLSSYKYKRYMQVGFLVVFCCLLFLNITRQFIWKDRITFWSDVSQKTTKSSVPFINLGMAQIEKGKLDDGIKSLEKSFDSGLFAPPRFKAIAANNLGIAYLNKNNFYTAEKWFSKGVKYDSTFHKSYFHLALIEFTIARDTGSNESLEKAEKYLKKAVSINKRYGRAYLMLANISMKKNKYAKAKSYARKAINSGLTDNLQRQALNILNSR